MAPIRVTIRRASPPRILDFDIETRKVGFHTAGKFAPAGCEPTAIACSWVGEDHVDYRVLGIDKPQTLLTFFRELYDQADIVTGHYIRRFDLPILNGAMLEHGLPSLLPKLVSDTKLDLRSRAGLSASQENLAGMYALAESKHHMGDYAWRESTRLTPHGIAETQKRVVYDVVQHKALREKLVAQGFLKDPRVWRP